MLDKENDNEMSMEEILASIRRYVADESPEANQSGLEYTTGHTAEVIRLTETVESNSKINAKTDFMPYVKSQDIPSSKISSLTQESEHLKRDHDLTFSPEPTPAKVHHSDAPLQQQMPSAFTPQIHEPVIVPFQKGGYQGGYTQNQSVQNAAQMPSQPSYVQESSPFRGDNLHQNFSDVITDKTVHSTSQAFSKLSEAFQMAKAEKQQMDAQRNHGASAIESFVIELAKPMVRQWIEQHLPSLVDKLVTQEIEKLTDEMRKKLF
ncbi:MAG: hypothetical protein HEEMFOPI_00462 [Holosporales bacterium]